ncbi:hypothetical protein GW17_00039843 [Ensete ventricosum]|nr:hypothetical protein GW17_00039843 [Ensete ventricosum]
MHRTKKGSEVKGEKGRRRAFGNGVRGVTVRRRLPHHHHHYHHLGISRSDPGPSSYTNHDAPRAVGCGSLGGPMAPVC